MYMINLLGIVDDDCPCMRYELHPIFRKQCQASLNVFVTLPAGPEHPPDDDDGAEGDGHEGFGGPEGTPQSVQGGPSGLGQHTLGPKFFVTGLVIFVTALATLVCPDLLW